MAITEAIYKTTDIVVNGKVIGQSMTVIENRPVPAERLVIGAPTPIVAEVTNGEGELEWIVTYDWSKVANVTRPNTGGSYTGYGAKGKKLADRLAAATRAGVVHYDAYIQTDVNGGTFVTSNSRAMAKYLNADLKRLGF